MKTRPFLLSMAVLALCPVPRCAAASSPWDGTWKINQAKSKMIGEIFTLTALPNDGFHLSTSSHSMDRDYICDGKDYLVVGDQTGTCKKVDDTHYEMAGKLKGQPEWHGTSVISGDGKFMKNTAYLRRPDGSEELEENTYQRIGTGTGRAGTWRNVKSSSNVADIMKIKVTGDTMRSEMPAYKMVTTSKLDGSPAKIEGPLATNEFTLEVKADSPTRLHYVQMLNGKPTTEGTQTLSADGKTMTEEEWEAGSPNQKQTYVFEKQ